MKIDDATVDSNVTGVEKIPVSDGGSPKVVTVQAVGDYVLARILALVAGEKADSLGTDSVLGARSGSLATFSASKMVALALASVWNGTTATAIDAATVPLTSGATKGVVTLAQLSAFFKTKIGTELLALSGLSAVTTFASGDLILVSQSGTSKKATWAQLIAAVDASIADYVSAQVVVTEPANENLIPIVYGGALRKVTIGVLKSILGTVGMADALSTENNVPQWSSGNGILKNGIPVVITARADGTATDAALPSEKLVRSLIGFVGHYQRELNTVFPYDTPAIERILVRMPSYWDRGAFKVRLAWYPGAGAVSGNKVKFDIGVRVVGDGIALEGANAALVSVIDTVTGGDGIVEVSVGSADISVSGGTMLLFTISRDFAYVGAGGVLSGNATLLSFEIEYKKAISEGAW